MKCRPFPARVAILAALSLAAACATLPENVGRMETFAYPETGDTILGRAISREAAGTFKIETRSRVEKATHQKKPTKTLLKR